ncbi:late secretory pathway protein AVL9 homolog [Petromyzon marinus]|uniref:Late secretory pathway protein AVL9 homolog n=1 Tax=Petromyzon marinus TaxID=7757 RepID=A0AAJ7WLU4_PETMA|nr:late secretory pathway protein AVL9 homolog [Petromyzon marinus]
MEASVVKDESKGGPVLHVAVVGFHHKKGCQVEFSYPPLLEKEGHDSHSLPEEWKYLPFLALPDGAHNFQEDTVFFLLPARDGEKGTVYGVSCYKQIEAKTLKVREADVTRETVQKSVCVLSNTPLFGLLQAKLQLITHAYFEEKDFSQISILKELYDHVNSSLKGSLLEGSQAFLGLSARDLVLRFKHKVLILFKLLLLEKKVMFVGSPVHKLVSPMIALLSLFPGMIEYGLLESSWYKPHSSVSSERDVTDVSTDEFVSVSASDIPEPGESRSQSEDTNGQLDENSPTPDSDTSLGRTPTAVVLLRPEEESAQRSQDRLSPYRSRKTRPSPASSESDWETLDPGLEGEDLGPLATKAQEQDYPVEQGVGSLILSPAQDEESAARATSVLPVAPLGPVHAQVGKQDDQAAKRDVHVPGIVSGLEEDLHGMPLPIFTKGYLLLPYMALQQHHLLSDVSVRGFLAGATNVLFRQQKHLSDVIVDVEECRLEIQDPELRRMLALGTADLRFADWLVKHVADNRQDVFLDGTGWEGGDEWVRSQFSFYLLSLLATTLQPDNEKLLADFGMGFVTAWQDTHNYRVWNSNTHPGMDDVQAGHAFHGQYSVADVKLRLAHSVSNSERGKKIGNAVITTSRSVVQTSKAVGHSVGGALTNAKSAMSSWFTNLTTQPAEKQPDKD